MHNITNYAMTQELDSLNPPIKNNDIVYCQIYVGTNTNFDY